MSSSGAVTSLTWQQFVSQALDLVQAAKQLNDGWVWNTIEDVPGGSFLSKSSISSNPSSVAKVMKFEHHVVYSTSYEVPVLYFNAVNQDGSCLGVEEIWSRIPHVFRSHVNPGAEATFEFFGEIVTQAEHPLLGTPFFMIHPCRTSQLMAQVLGKDHGNFLVSWLSSVGQIVGLSLNLEYGKRLAVTS